GRPATGPAPPPRRGGPRSPTVWWRYGLAAARDLPSPGQIGVVVALPPLDLPNSGHSNLTPPIDELLITVLIVQFGVAPPGRLERIGQGRRGGRLDQRGADVLAVRLRRIQPLVDASHP